MDPYLEIREALKKKKKTITWLAEEIGTSQQSLSRNLKDQNLSLSNYIKITNALGMNISYSEKVESLKNIILEQKIQLQTNRIGWKTAKRFGLIYIEDINTALELLRPGSSQLEYDNYIASEELSDIDFDIERLLFIKKTLLNV